MEKEEIRKVIEGILETPQPGIMSTAYGNEPYCRSMMFHNDGWNFYAGVKAGSVDVDEIKKNNLSYIILGYDADMESSYLEILAETEVVMDQPTLDWFRDQGANHNPEMTLVLKFIPEQIKLMNANDEIDKPEVLDFAG